MRAIARTLRDGLAEIQQTIEATGRGVTEAVGGFFEMTNEHPTFVPLDEFISQKFLEDVEGDLASHDLVLETEY